MLPPYRTGQNVQLGSAVEQARPSLQCEPASNQDNADLAKGAADALQRLSLPVGALDGDFTVTPNGSAQYSISLRVSPGRQAMHPKLSLSYDSRRGDGILGKGWGVAGLTRLHRCPKTPAQDGFRGGIELTNEDSLCLDDSRLVLNDTQSCQVDSELEFSAKEYRTISSPFDRVCAFHDKKKLTAGPEYFSVYRKNGTIARYGTPDVVGDVRDEDGTLIHVAWPITRLMDRRGNYIDFIYHHIR